MPSIYLKFYLTEKQKYGSHLLYEWMLDQAKHIGISVLGVSFNLWIRSPWKFAFGNFY